MNTELKNAVEATDRDAQYDESAKRLLGQKSILAQKSDPEGYDILNRAIFYVSRLISSQAKFFGI